MASDIVEETTDALMTLPTAKADVLARVHSIS